MISLLYKETNGLYWSDKRDRTDRGLDWSCRRLDVAVQALLVGVSVEKPPVVITSSSIRERLVGRRR